MNLVKLIMISGISLFLARFTLEAIQTKIITWDKTEMSSLLQPGKSFSKTTFITYNKGQSRMRINEARCESNAIKTTIKKRIIEPGESAKIEVIFLSEGKEAGLYHNKIDVYFEGHEDPLATLHYIVSIPKLIKCTPNTLNWGEKNHQSAFLIELELDNRFVNTINSVDYDQHHYKVTLIPDSIDSFKYNLKIEPITKRRPFSSLIRIKAGGPELVEIEETIFLFNSHSLSL